MCGGINWTSFNVRQVSCDRGRIARLWTNLELGMMTKGRLGWIDGFAFRLGVLRLSYQWHDIQESRSLLNGA